MVDFWNKEAKLSESNTHILTVYVLKVYATSLTLHYQQATNPRILLYVTLSAWHLTNTYMWQLMTTCSRTVPYFCDLRRYVVLLNCHILIRFCTDPTVWIHTNSYSNGHYMHYLSQIQIDIHSLYLNIHVTVQYSNNYSNSPRKSIYLFRQTDRKEALSRT